MFFKTITENVFLKTFPPSFSPGSSIVQLTPIDEAKMSQDWKQGTCGCMNDCETCKLISLNFAKKKKKKKSKPTILLLLQKSIWSSLISIVFIWSCQNLKFWCSVKLKLFAPYIVVNNSNAKKKLLPKNQTLLSLSGTYCLEHFFFIEATKVTLFCK